MAKGWRGKQGVLPLFSKSDREPLPKQKQKESLELLSRLLLEVVRVEAESGRAEDE